MSCSCILSGSYNNFFKSFNRQSKQELMFECSREQTRPRQLLRPKRVVVNSNLNGAPNTGGNSGSSSPSMNTKRNGQQQQQQQANTILNGAKSATNAAAGGNGFRDEVNVDQLDFTKKILHASWHPKDNIVAIAATNNLYLFYNREVYHLCFYSTFSLTFPHHLLLFLFWTFFEEIKLLFLKYSRLLLPIPSFLHNLAN